MSVTVHPMTEADWPVVAEIYRQGIAAGQATFETTVPTWETWNAAHLLICRLVAKSATGVCGWAALTPISKRACYAGVAEFSVYIHEEYRGQGVGKMLLAALIAASEQHGIYTLQASTFAENTPSLRLQERLGFRIVGRRERIAKLHGIWRDTVLTERRSTVVGCAEKESMA